MSAWEQGLLASLLAGLATGIGSIPVLVGGRLPHRVFDGLMGFAAGVMLAISTFEIVAGLGQEQAGTLAGAVVGGLAVLVVRAFTSGTGPVVRRRLQRGGRIALVVTLHNLVEGMIVMSSYVRTGATVGLGVALAIAIHNLPEGLAVAEPLRRSGVPAWRCVAMATLSGLGEPLGALVATAVLSSLVPTATWAALAAGAMIVLAAIELIPEAFSHSYETEAAVGLLCGIVTAFGLIAGPT
jgi:ZIP family zinc transporter